MADSLQSCFADWYPFQPLLTASHDAETKSLEPIIPPINRLPIEVLSAIFSTEPGDLPSSPKMKGAPKERRLIRHTLVCGKKIDPVLLGQVCEHWRIITLTTPLLWASFSVSCNLKAKTVKLLKLWLKRSADVPLNIMFFESLGGMRINYLHCFFPPNNPVTPKVMELLLAHAHRWKAVDFLFSFQISPLLQDLPQDSFRMLESVKLRREMNVHFNKLPPVIKVWDLFHASPSFRTAKYEMEYAQHKLRDIPWSRLTSVDVTILMDELFTILPECENLEELRYTDSMKGSANLPEGEEPPARLLPVILPSLRYLSMTVSSPPDEAFRNLTLPKLESVHIVQNNIWIEKPDPDAFTDSLKRSKCTLKKFSYHALGDPAAEEILCEMLSSSSMSSVVDLFVEVRVTDKFADLMMNGVGQMALPRLESFTLVRSSMKPGTLSKMIDFLKEGRKSFWFFSIQIWKRYEEDRKKFLDLGERGLVIRDRHS